VPNELLEAIEQDDERRALELLARNPELASTRDAHGLSALLFALYRGREELARAVHVAKPRLDVHEAAAIGDVDQLRVLLEEDPALVSAWSVDGFTPLHYAAFFGRRDAAELLVKHRADLEAPARNEQFAPDARPLHSAAAAGQHDVVALLLDAGADPNARQHAGYTPLLEAAQRGDAELADLLLGAGADPSVTLEDGRSAAQLARDAGAPDLARRLGER
jgi:uncharacterized protein